MEKKESLEIYDTIATRTNGDLYIGVVGPVRTGKSTFITRFMENVVLPNIKNKNVKNRAIDELPQSADGKVVMTTQPKFVPNEAVKITFGNSVSASVRLIDCVGYMVDGATDGAEEDAPRMVTTPWSTEPMPFDKAAEIGTQKVVGEHSTVAVVVTNDGTITEIPRVNFVSAEERVIGELKELKKPFIIVLNSKTPNSDECKALAEALEQRHDAKVLPMSVANMGVEDCEAVLSALTEEFPIKKIVVDMPKWMRTLPSDNFVIEKVIDNIRDSVCEMSKMKHFAKMIENATEDENVFAPVLSQIKLGEGVINYEIKPKDGLFYKVLSDFAKQPIEDEFSLMSFVSKSAEACGKYEKFSAALDEAEASGYGVVNPSMDGMEMLSPEIVKQGSKYGVKLKATAPSWHILKVDVTTEVNPMVGTEQQSQYLLSEFQNDPQGIWNTNMFGKSMSELAKESLSTKASSMPVDARAKIRKTVGRIVNENKGGLICFIL